MQERENVSPARPLRFILVPIQGNGRVIYRSFWVCMILAMAKKRIIDVTRCHAWIYEEGRQCKTRKPGDRSEEPDTAWYCPHHTWLRRMRSWLRYKWKRAPRWKRILLIPLLGLFLFVSKHGIELYGLAKDWENDRKLDAISAHFSEQKVRAYLDREYPLGEVLPVSRPNS